MEGNAFAAGVDPLHFCHWRQPYRVCGQTDHAPVWHREPLALPSGLYSAHYPHLAHDGIADKHSFWAVSFFYRLPQKNRKTDGFGKEISQNRPFSAKNQRKPMKRIAIFASGAGSNASVSAIVNRDSSLPSFSINET